MQFSSIIYAGLAATGMAFASSVFAVANAATFTLDFSVEEYTGNNAKVDFQLKDTGNGKIGVTAKVDQSVAMADLQGIWFNVADESILSYLTLENVSVGGLNAPATTPVNLTASANNVSNLGGGANLNGGGNPCRSGCDGGIRIGTSGIGSDDIQTISWQFALQNHPSSRQLTLQDFATNWAVRATSVTQGASRDGSSKLQGLADPDDIVETPVKVPEPALTLALGMMAIGTAKTLKKQQALAITES